MAFSQGKNSYQHYFFMQIFLAPFYIIKIPQWKCSLKAFMYWVLVNEQEYSSLGKQQRSKNTLAPNAAQARLLGDIDG